MPSVDACPGLAGHRSRRSSTSSRLPPRGGLERRSTRASSTMSRTQDRARPRRARRRAPQRLSQRRRNRADQCDAEEQDDADHPAGRRDLQRVGLRCRASTLSTARWRCTRASTSSRRPGPPIVAAAGGVVIASEWHHDFGNMIEIDHGNDITTLYAHASKVYVRVGDVVKRNQHIADVGLTGRATGAHLHFEVHVKNVPQNPEKFLHADRVPGDRRRPGPGTSLTRPVVCRGRLISRWSDAISPTRSDPRVRPRKSRVIKSPPFASANSSSGPCPIPTTTAPSRIHRQGRSTPIAASRSAHAVGSCDAPSASSSVVFDAASSAHSNER